MSNKEIKELVKKEMDALNKEDIVLTNFALKQGMLECDGVIPISDTLEKNLDCFPDRCLTSIPCVFFRKTNDNVEIKMIVGTSSLAPMDMYIDKDIVNVFIDKVNSCFYND